jgi:hypothetical protein
MSFVPYKPFMELISHFESYGSIKWNNNALPIMFRLFYSDLFSFCSLHLHYLYSTWMTPNSGLLKFHIDQLFVYVCVCDMIGGI